jgi:NADH-quinone oxidoreductase subunit A
MHTFSGGYYCVFYFSAIIVFNIPCLIFVPAEEISLMYQSYFLQTPAAQAISDLNSSANYFPIGMQLIFAILFVGGMITLSYFLGPKRITADKLQTFESGIEQQGNARQPMAIKYFLVAILFVLFDVEVIFFYPYAVNFRELGWNGFLAVVLFVGFFLSGFIYIIKKGALHWED